MKTDFCFVAIIKNIQSNPYSKQQAFGNAERIKVLNIHELSSLWYLGKTSPLILTFTAVSVSHFTLLVTDSFNTGISMRSPFIAYFTPLHFEKHCTKGLGEKQKVFTIFSLLQSVTGENTNGWIFFLLKCVWSRAFCLR